MKRIHTVLSLFLAFLLLSAGWLCGCGQNHPAQSETPSETEAEKIPPVYLTDDKGVFLYTVIRGDLCSEMVKTAGTELRKKINTLLDNNQKAPIGTDWVADYDAADLDARFEILVGPTNRPQSELVLQALGDNQFSVKYFPDVHKIVIIGADDEHTLMASQYFFDSCLGHADGQVWISEGLDVVQTRTFAPVDTTLDARLIKASDTVREAFVADIQAVSPLYDVDPTGARDSTDALNRALSDCSKAGGGTVYLPRGRYRITDTITIPSFVTLRGEWAAPGSGTPDCLTVLLAFPKTGGSLDQGLIVIHGSAGAVGLTVYYPGQSLWHINPYDPTFYIPGGQGDRYMVQTIRDVTVVNGYVGVAATTDGEKVHEQLYLDNLYLTCLHTGLRLFNSADVDTYRNITVSPDVWAAYGKALSGTEVSRSDVSDYTRKHTIGMELGDLDWPQSNSVLITDCQYGVRVVEGSRSRFCGSFFELTVRNTSTAFCVQKNALDTRWGVQISRSFLEGTERGVLNLTDGVVKMAGTTVIGGVEGFAMYDTVDLSSYPPDDGTGAPQSGSPSALLCFTYGRNGKEDVSSALQGVLDLAGTTGAAVYLPAGIYRLNSPVTVPSGVELRGASTVATRDQDETTKGTQILSSYLAPENNPDAAALITLSEDAGLYGLRIAMTSNGAALKNQVCAIRGTGSGVRVVNCCITTAGTGVDFRGCDRHRVSYLTAYCYDACILAGGQGGSVSDFLFNPTVCVRRGTSYSYTDGSDFTSFLNAGREGTTAIRLESAIGERLERVFAYGVKDMLHADSSSDVLAINLGTDNIGDTQLRIRNSSLTGINLMRYNGQSCDADDRCVISLYNRLAIWDQWEPDFEGTPAALPPVKDSSPALVQNCDNGLPGMEKASGGQAEGSGCASLTLGSSGFFQSNLPFSAMNAADKDAIALDVYLSNAQKVLGNMTVFILELTSSGTIDKEEYEWYVGIDRKAEMHDGWNTVYLYFDEAKQTGKIRLSSVNFIRLFAYWTADAVGEEIRIDNIRLSKTGGRSEEAYGFSVIRGTPFEDDIRIP
ncbi:MAG: hypothetical protein IJU20_02415 [Clostridia bacterium]|nr:hypothetical protein [Clostridia bacterium]